MKSGMSDFVFRFLFVFINHPSRKKATFRLLSFFLRKVRDSCSGKRLRRLQTPFGFSSLTQKKATFRLLSFFFFFFFDSNPRYAIKRIPDFESSAFGHSANLPFYDAKLVKKLQNAKLFFEKMWLVCVRIFFTQYMLAHRCGMMWFVELTLNKK